MPTTNTITDDQIRELRLRYIRDSCSPQPRVCARAIHGFTICSRALGVAVPWNMRQISQRMRRAARKRCADIINTQIGIA